MTSILNFIADSLLERVQGPMSARLLLQPIVAAAFAIRSGLKDARLGNPPYFWGLFTNPGKRRDMLRDGWKSIGKVFLIACALDAVYQFAEQRFVYPIEVLAVAFVLAILPYLVLRGATTRIARWFKATQG